jgi:flagellar protein FlbD
MIRLTRLNHVPLVLNADLIEHIDVTPDTVITLTTGQILRVRETADEVVERIVEFRRRILAPPPEPSRMGREEEDCQPAGNPELPVELD